MTPEEKAEEQIALARKALKKERLGTALDWYYDAVTTFPEKVDYRAEMVTACLIPMGMEKHAFVEAVRAIHIDNKSAKAWRALGVAENTLGNVAHAISAFDKQLELAPDSPQALLDRSGVALDIGDWETATKLCRRILELDKVTCTGDALHLLALAYYRQGRHEEAIELDDGAIEAGCLFPDVAKWNKSLALLALGRYKEGWEGHMSRAKSPGDIYSMEMFRRFDKPIMTSDDGPCHVHVAQEMGFGDCIIMMRYLPMLLERGYQVQLEVDSGLVGLLEYSFPDVKVMRKAPNFPGTLGIPDFDKYIPALNLPVIFKTDSLDLVPWNGPYIKVHPDKIAEYQDKLKYRPPGSRVIGLCWSSGLFTQGVNARWHGEFNRRKSIGIQNLKPIFGTGDLFVSLQVGPTSREGDGYTFTALPDNPSWMDTAGLVACCDYVVSVDTGVAHLAGAMGKPLLVMLHSEGVWQWGPRGETSPWYPSAKVFRAKKPHEWEEVVRQIGKELNDTICTDSSVGSNPDRQQTVLGSGIRAAG